MLYSNCVETFTLPSFAKINPYLRVLGKRPDGFHEIFTVFQTVSLHDDLEFAEGGEVLLECSDERIPRDETNLIIRAARMLNERGGTSHGAVIRLEKRIPSPGGLGGGSSNAAAALIGLSRLWKLGASLDDLAPIAADLGSDVPFFLTGGTAIGTGRGEKIEDAIQISKPHLLIVTPDVSVSTAHAYSLLGAENLTSEALESILFVCRSEAKLLDLRHGVLRNDIEGAVFKAFPEIGRVRERLARLGAANVLMSGSGASVFAVYEKEETRQTAIKALDDEVNWRTFAVAAVSREEYREKVYGRL